MNRRAFLCACAKFTAAPVAAAAAIAAVKPKTALSTFGIITGRISCRGPNLHYVRQAQQAQARFFRAYPKLDAWVIQNRFRYLGQVHDSVCFEILPKQRGK